MSIQKALLDEGLKQWATQRQIAYIDAVNATGSMREAARKLGVAYTAVRQAIESAKTRAALQGFSPEHHMHHIAPAPFKVKGVSTYFDRDGQPRGQWVKTTLDNAGQEQAIRDFVEYLVTDAKGMANPLPPPKIVQSDLLVVYPVADTHLGLYSWAQETGEDFDLPTAERLLTRGAARLVERAPPAEHALLMGLGDLLHADDSRNVTPASGNQLDVDTRHAKVMQVALRSIRNYIDLLLTKHKTVTVWIKGGNHDPHSSFAIALCLASFYEREPRLRVDLSPSLFSYYHFGKVLIGGTHGHTVKQDDLAGIMSDDQPQAWGNSVYRYFYSGHIHHKTRLEKRGVICETFRSMAARDAWHAGRGYRAGRDMEMIVHHKEHGEIERHVAPITMLRGSEK